MNSIHQSAFFNSLAQNKDYDITLIITEKFPDDRVEMGWENSNLTNVSIIDYPEEIVWKRLIDENNGNEVLHVFSGIGAYKGVHRAFKYAIKNRCVMGVLTEPLKEDGFKGILRNIRSVLHRIKYGHRISLLLGMGQLAVNQFIRWGYSPNRVFLWAYCTEAPEVTYAKCDTHQYKIMFAGSMIMRKGYDLLIAALKTNQHKDFVADFYCVSEKNASEAYSIKTNSGLKEKLNMFQFLPNDIIRQKMTEYDLLVLPSRHDGWGAVVNESLMVGTPVLVSEFCGSSTLLRANTIVGKVIAEYSIQGIANELSELIEEGKIDLNRRTDIAKWASLNISGEALAKYFDEILRHLKRTSNEIKPQAPWLHQSYKNLLK